MFYILYFRRCASKSLQISYQRFNHSVWEVGISTGRKKEKVQSRTDNVAAVREFLKRKYVCDVQKLGFWERVSTLECTAGVRIRLGLYFLKGERQRGILRKSITE